MPLANWGKQKKQWKLSAKMEQRQAADPDSVIDAELSAEWYVLRNLDKAFYYINHCINKRMGPVNYFLEYRACKGVKGDPRYEESKRRTGV